MYGIRGNIFSTQLKELATKISRHYQEVRGVGLILAIDIDGSSATVAKDCMEQGILVNSIQPGTLRFIPPLIVSQKNIDTLIRVLSQKLDQTFIKHVTYSTEGDVHDSPSLFSNRAASSYTL